ncbi:ankyrin and armadillo repeat-containing protein [Heteronotia binoei]|uniref:ankyrin and armadillo repeat-containing protein n=1 Tax=Heteronotia binoei TaxID=13085 RepID=UPI002931AB43|nr:ankyrin and armadillo repeat-containing protein [Heteronotia binoei]
MLRPLKKPLPRNEQADEAAYLAQLAAQRNASAFFEKYERSELQELLTTSFCSWLASKDDLRHPMELPSGLMSQMRSITYPNVILLTPVEPGIDLDAKEIHQIVRELAVGVYCLNQIPSISLDANYDQSTSCSLPPAYYDTRIGQMLISVDYMLKALWHGAYMPKEKRVRFSELWRSSMDIDVDGAPQTEKTACAEFCSAGLIDISRDPDFKGIYDENFNEDPTYEPDSAEEKDFFMQFADYILLQLAFATVEVQQTDNVFKFEAAYTLTNAIRMTNDRLDTTGYQRLQQRLVLQQKLIKKYLERKADIRKNIAYLKLMSFLIPFMTTLKRKNKIPNLNRLLQPYSDDKVKTERELPPFLLGSDFKCQHFTYAQNQYFHLHGGIEFDVGTPPLEDISDEIKAAYDDMYLCATKHLTQLLDPDVPYREHYPIPVMDFEAAGGGKKTPEVTNQEAIEKLQSMVMEGFKQNQEALENMKTDLMGQITKTNKQLEEFQKQLLGNTQQIHCLTAKVDKIAEKEKEVFNIARGNKESVAQLEERVIKLEMEKAAYILRFQNLPEEKGEKLLEKIVELLTFEDEEWLEEGRRDIEWVKRVSSNYTRKYKLAREVQVKFTRLATCERILKKTKDQELKWKETNIKVLKEVPWEVRQRRAKYRKLATWLTRHSVQFKWLVPEGMFFTYHTKRQNITSLEKLEEFWDQYVDPSSRESETGDEQEDQEEEEVSSKAEEGIGQKFQNKGIKTRTQTKKSMSFGMRAAAERGLAAIFLTFCRKTSISSLALTDDHGFALIHHAAIHNRVSIICQLLKSSLTINQKRHIPYSQGPTALHFAAQSGSLESLHFLLALKADYRMPDNRGWMPIHFAAYYDNIACFTILYRKSPDLLEAETRAESRSTPLLLAAASGALDTIQYLFSLNVNWLKKDSEGNNMIHLAVLNFHTEVLKHLIELDVPDLPVWTTLVGMLDCAEHSRREMAVRCLEVLCLAKDHYWKFILDAGTIPSLINVLKSQSVKLECITVGVLSNITTHNSIARAFVEAGGVAVLIKLLASDEPELLSRCAVILYDLAQLDNNQMVIAELDGIPALVNLLRLDIEDLLVNVINCIRVLCMHNKENQLRVRECRGIRLLVQFLTSDSDVLLAVASAALAELARGNKKMQNAIVEAHVIGPLVELLRVRKISVQVKGAMAIQTLCEKNTGIQMRFLAKSVTKFLLKLLKAFQLKVKEQGAVTLWALAGQTLKQQKYMAEQIGYNLIIDMLLSPSDKMQCVGGEAVIALSKDSQMHQNQICKGNGIAPLVRLLRSSRIAEGTLLSIIRALGTICVGEAIINNPISQENVVDEGALPILVNLLQTHHSLQIKVEVAVSLACIVLKNSRLQTILQDQEGFCYSNVLHLLYSRDKDIRLRAGYAVALYAYNNPTQQLLILETGPISLSVFEPFLESPVETEKAMAAFQIVVLARIIVDKDQVSLSARGVSILVDLLCSEEAGTLVLTGKLLASLAHTRAGIPEAITTLGTVQRLCYHLYAKEEEVCISMACALGYLTYNRTAYRHLLVQCRNKPRLFKRLIKNLSRDARINPDFVREFRRQKKVGLPSLSLEINGGPPAVPVHIRDKSRDEDAKIYKSRFHPKDSLFLVPTSSHLMGRFRTSEKPRAPTVGHYQMPHTTPSDLIQVIRPRIVNSSALQCHMSGKKP